jgi:hypothetical protein
MDVFLTTAQTGSHYGTERVRSFYTKCKIIDINPRIKDYQINGFNIKKEWNKTEFLNYY